MICFRDMTFCPEWIHERCLLSKDCPRTLTEDVQIAAKEWWGSDDAPICIWAEEPECLEEKKDDSV